MSDHRQLSKLGDDGFIEVVRSMDTCIDHTLNQLVPLIHGPIFPVDRYETSTGLVIEAQLPDTDRSQVHVNVWGNQLNIVADYSEVKEIINDKRNWNSKEQSYQYHERTILLPYPISKSDLTTTFDKGRLRIVIAKPMEMFRNS